MFFYFISQVRLLKSQLDQKNGTNQDQNPEVDGLQNGVESLLDLQSEASVQYHIFVFLFINLFKTSRDSIVCFCVFFQERRTDRSVTWSSNSSNPNRKWPRWSKTYAAKDFRTDVSLCLFFLSLIFFSIQTQVIRLEGQVTRYKSASENSEKVEDELKVEKRKLQREVRGHVMACCCVQRWWSCDRMLLSVLQLRAALDRVDELELSNLHLNKRLDKMKANRSALLAQQWPRPPPAPVRF